MGKAKETTAGKWLTFARRPFDKLRRRPSESQPAVKAPVVTIKANPHFPAVNFFIDEEGAGAVEIAPGTRCTYLDGPIEVEIHGVTMRFYKLEHGALVGYVNVRCVDASHLPTA